MPYYSSYRKVNKQRGMENAPYGEKLSLPSYIASARTHNMLIARLGGVSRGLSWSRAVSSGEMDDNVSNG
jgi:hypothetical protein